MCVAYGLRFLCGDSPQPSLLCRTPRRGSSQTQPVAGAISMLQCWDEQPPPAPVAIKTPARFLFQKPNGRCFQSFLIEFYSETKCHLKINVPLYAALLSHLFHSDGGMELNYKSCNSWVTTGSRAHSQGAKTWSSLGRVGKTISCKEIWWLKQTGTVSLPPIPTAVRHRASTPVGLSPHPSSLCQAQSVPPCRPLEMRVGVIEQRSGCAAGEVRSACSRMEMTKAFFFFF